MSDTSSAPAVKYRRIRIAAILISVASVFVLLRSLPLDSLKGSLERMLADLGPWGPVAFALIYIVATVLMLPASVLTLLGAAVFGFWTGYIAVTVGSVVGAACSFLIARYAARSKVEQIANEYPKFGAIDDAISEGGWKIVALLRLSPAVPFNLQNYLYGLTKIRFWPYVLTSWLSMIPGTLMYVYLGHAAGQAAGERERTLGEWGLLAVGLLATIVVSVYVTRLAKRKLAQQPGLSVAATAKTAPATFPTKAVVSAIILASLAAVAATNGKSIRAMFPNDANQMTAPQ
jgi:uncharacterized membrane protein YdjX (TVP38/TMEM64 family)